MVSAAGTGSSEPDGDRGRIVVGVDGSENGDRALDWAAAQAERTGAVLEMRTSYGPGYVFVTPSEVDQAMRHVLDAASARVAKVAPKVVMEGKSHEGSPATDLIEASEGADLLVVGSRGLGGFRGLLLGSVSHQCSLHARCPVVIVR
jgi:nucleotide-binding universal stress UspA family protein